MINRIIFKHLASLLDVAADSTSVILIDGARQVGKTTLIASLLSQDPRPSISINLEEDLVFRNKIDQSKSFEEFQKLLMLYYQFNDNHKQILFIDEAQESEKLGSYVRFMKEKWKNTRTILTGSSMTRLFRKKQRIPVGRYRTVTVYPFSFLEFLSAIKKGLLREEIEQFAETLRISPLIHKEILTCYDLYLKIGGLPEVVMTFAENGDYKNLREVILTSQKEDFIRRSTIDEQMLFQQGLKGIANHLGSPAKYTHISESSHQGKVIVEQLLLWHLAHEIEQKGINSTSQFLPKRYLYDLGVAQDLRNMPFPELSLLNTLNSSLRTQLGGLCEMAVLLNMLSSGPINGKIASWKKGSTDSPEVDFIWQGIPIEVKAALKVSKRNFSAVQRYLEQSEQDFGVVVSAAPYERFKVNKHTLLNLPIYLVSPDLILNLKNP